MNKNTAVDVEIVAEVVGEERAWAGLLTAVFADGSHRERNVSGVKVNNYLLTITTTIRVISYCRKRFFNPYICKQTFQCQ